MKRLVLILCLLAAPAWADYYYAKVDTNTLAVTADYKTTAPDSTIIYGKRVLVEISQQEYQTKQYGDLSAKVAAAVTVRKNAQAALKEISPEVLKAVVSALVKVINIRLPAGQKITADEVTAAIKEEL